MKEKAINESKTKTKYLNFKNISNINNKKKQNSRTNVLTKEIREPSRLSQIEVEHDSFSFLN